MSEQESAAAQVRPFLTFCGMLVVIAVLYFAREVLIPVAVAFVLTFALSPLVLALQRRGLKRVPAVLVVVTLVTLLLAGTSGILMLQLSNLDEDLAAKEDQIVAKVTRLKKNLKGGFVDNVTATFTRIQEKITEEDTKNKKPHEIVGGVGPSAKPGNLPGEKDEPTGTEADPLKVEQTTGGIKQIMELVGPAGHHAAQGILCVMLVIFMLVQRENLRNRIVRLIGQGSLIATTRAMNEGAQRLSKFLLVQLLINTGFGVLITAGLLVMGLVGNEASALTSTAVLWGVLVGALRYIPYIGIGIGGALMLAYCALMVPGWEIFFAALIWFLFLSFLGSYVAEPLLFGRSTGVSTVALLVGLGFWTWLWGAIGLLLSVPLTVALVVLGRHVPGLAFLETLLGENPEIHPEVTFYQRLLARDADEADELVDHYLAEHQPSQLFEKVLLPALLLAKQDHLRGQLSDGDLRFVSRTLKEVLEDLRPAREAEGATTPGIPPTNKNTIYLLGCPGHDEVDEMALLLLEGLMEPSGYDIEVIPDEALTSEILEQIRRRPPTVVCIASLPPAGLAPTRYLCKRIRSQCPNVRIAVGYWGGEGDIERIEERLKEAGAEFVATTLAGTREQVAPILQTTARIARGAEATSNNPSLAEEEQRNVSLTDVTR